MELLKELCESYGVSGFEDEIRGLIKSKMKPLVNEMRTDALGNVIGLLKAKRISASKYKENIKRKKVMISAHMDEIGFIVKHIEKGGFLRIEPLGGFDPKTLIAKRVIVHAKSGKLPGLIGLKPIHTMTEEDKKRMPEIKDLFVDIGFNEKRVRKEVEIGTVVSLSQKFQKIGDMVSCKSFDDRVGVYVMLETIRKIKNPMVDIYAVASTQEEVGLRGALVSAFGIEPDIGIAIDVTIANDIPGANNDEIITSLGKGTAIKIKDSASISNPKLVKFMRKLAEKKKIKYQLEILPRGGTDAGALQRARHGCPVVTISIPTRYVHSVAEAANVKDIEASINLLVSFLENAHKEDFTL